MIRNAIIVILVAMSCYACSKSTPNGNNPPTLRYLGLEQDTMPQIGPDEAGIIAVLAFEDVDGDIVGGNEQANISFVDNRDGSIDIAAFPVLPDLGDSQKGTLRLRILPTCCIYPPNVADPCTSNVEDFPSVQLTYDIFIEDSAGNKSNNITTDVITLICN